MATQRKDPVVTFLEMQDLAALEKQIVFDKAGGFGNLLCCYGVVAMVSSFGISVCLCPIGSCCPCVLVKYFDLKLDSDSVKASSVFNDFCCHKAITQKTVPLDKIQDVSLSENCIQTCFGQKSVNIQTAGANEMEVAAEFLANPQQARDAIQLAVRLYRARADVAPGQHSGMTRTAADSGGVTLMGRLALLDQLVKRGALDSEEARGMRVAVLANEDAGVTLARIGEARTLLEKEIISADEYRLLKTRLVAQIAQ